MNVNYVIAAYAGERASPDPRAVLDTTYYLRLQLETLKTLKHNLSQITIVNSRTVESVPYRVLISNLPREINGAKVVLMEKENKGISYSAYSLAYTTYRDEFDYYILNEDDYIPVKDNFDSILVEEFEKVENTGFLCGFATPWIDWVMHASISWGITSAKVLEKVVSQNDGRLPSADGIGDDFGTGQTPGQVWFSKGFTDAGYEIRDVRERFCVPFNGIGVNILYFHSEHEDYLIVPSQVIDTYRQRPKII